MEPIAKKAKEVGSVKAQPDRVTISTLMTLAGEFYPAKHLRDSTEIQTLGLHGDRAIIKFNLERGTIDSFSMIVVGPAKIEFRQPKE